jgi:VWFA-related protein
MLQKISLLLLAAIAIRQVEPQTPLKVNVDLVNVLFSVTDRSGKFVSGLKQEDIAVEEDGRKQDILRFTQENERPLTLGVLVDISPSVGRVFNDEKAAAISFLDTTLRSGDLAMVISFDHTVTLEEDFTEDKKVLRNAISKLNVGNGTSIYDAVYLACKEQFGKQAGRKAIILISDGQDTTSKIRMNEALLAAHQSDAVIYSISNRLGGFFDVPGSGAPATLKRFSLETGGTIFFVGGRTELTEVFAQIGDELRSQYSLAYTSSNAARDGRYRHVRIVSKDPTYTIKARQGYYAPTS